LISSISAHVGAPTQVAYCGTKGAISMLGKALGAVLGKNGIRVNASSRVPSRPDERQYVGSARRDEVLQRADRARADRQARRARSSRRLPCSRNDASYVTSATLLVDAGFIVNAEL